MALDILILTDDAQRASWYFDHAGHDVRDTLAEIQEGISHYIETHDNDGRLPEDLCGAVCATMAATILYGEATAAEQDMRDMGDVFASLANVQEAAGFAQHAVEHGDRMAVEVFWPDGVGDEDTVGDVAARLTSWVLAHLPESDPDAFLASLSLEAEVSES